MTNSIYPGISARKLQERSFLSFEFPREGEESDRVWRVYMPFTQNVDIQEHGRANLIDYNLVGRAGQLFSYGGADSRNISLDFSINLLHVLHLDETEGFTDRFKQIMSQARTTKESQRDAFKRDLKGGNVTDGIARNHAGDMRYLFSLITDFAYDNKQGAFEGTERWPSWGELLSGEDEITPEQQYKNAKAQEQQETRENANRYALAHSTGWDVSRVIDMVIFWLNLVRASVLNNSRNTTLGPPIVRINHGPLYRNVPCLVKDYDITISPDSGYHLETLMPHTFNVSMKLVESRTGDFGKYDPGEYVTGDNLTGWESIITRNEIDPRNGIIDYNGMGSTLL